MPVRKRPSTNHLRRERDRADILFVTVCVDQRLPVLAHRAVHAAIEEVWSDGSHWMVGKFMLLPDHVHLFAAPNGSEDLLGWTRFWKRRLNEALAPGLAIRWQPRCWDTQVRTGSHYDELWDYTRQNPVRRGLVDSSDDWPFQGEVHPLRWFAPR